MHTKQRWEAALAEADRMGCRVRLEPLAGTQGGLCEFGRQKWIFIDLTATASEQCDQLVTALRAAKAVHPSPALPSPALQTKTAKPHAKSSRNEKPNKPSHG